MSLAPLRVAAAAYVLDAISNEELRQVADEALCRGVYTWSLGELGTTTDPSQFVVRPLFERALKELGVPLPSMHEATERLLTYHLRRLTEGVATPYHTVREVRKATDPFARPAAKDGFSGEDLDRIASLVGCFYRYEYAADLSVAEQISVDSVASYTDGLDQEARQIAVDWTTARGRRCIDRSWLTWNDGTVRKMAQAIRDDHRFLDLPLLADALEEAGSSDVEILEHCREQTAHGSDCWVVQLLLAAG